MQHWRVYNDLTGPESAYRAVDSVRLTDAFSECCRLAEELNCLGKYGLTLLHNHTQLSTGEIIVESELRQLDDQLGFVSKKATLTEDCYPASWLIREGLVYPFEYVDEPTWLNIMGYRNEVFESQCFDILARYQLLDFIGVALVDRPVLARAGERPFFVERIEMSEFAQVVTLHSGDRKGLEATIPTRWVFRQQIGRGSALEEMTACEPLIVCIPTSVGHDQRPQGHVPDPD